MPNSINEEAQRRRRRDTWQSVLSASFWVILSACVLLYLRQRYVPEGFWSAAILAAVVLDLGMLIPVWILLKIRLKEIEGGEENAAAQY